MKLILSLIPLMFIVSGCQPTTDNKQNQGADLPACTKDAKVCPDGQTVSRNPELNCEFDACPEPASAVECQGDMKQCPDGSFVIRDPKQDCAFKACPEQSEQKPPEIYCTQDVAQCADGSYVGRDPKNECKFKPCPDGSNPGQSKTRIE